MLRYRTRLPPLDTLVFFEAVFRLRSFTKAADELLVSQAAVSKRIRQLEDWLETSLFLRDGHKLLPTQTGMILGECAGNTLQFLDQTLGNLRVHGDPVVRIGSMTAVGMFWLQGRLRNFAFSNEACPYSLTLSDTLGDFLTGGFDLVLVYGDGDMPGWLTHRLFDEELVPVASPQVADAFGRGDIRAPRLDYRRMAPDWVNWPIWSKQRSVPALDALPRQLCSSYAQSIGLALDSKGVALGSLPMLQEELDAGRLVRLPVEGLRTQRAYWLARFETQSPHKGVLAAWNALTKAP